MKRPELTSLDDIAILATFDWEAVERIEVTPPQGDFVAPLTHYRKLCEDPSGPWSANVIECAGRVVGFVMTAVEAELSTSWIGGFVVDRGVQNRGIAGRAMELLIDRARGEGMQHIALTCAPTNLVASRLYARHGFVPTGEVEGVELVLARDL